MIQQSYIWQQFNENIHCIPFCNNCVLIHTEMAGYISMHLKKN